MTKRFLFMLLALSFAPFIAKAQNQDISPAPLGHDTPINRAPPDWQRLKNYLASEGIDHATAALKTADLDDDGDLDVIAKLTGPSWCGTGVPLPYGSENISKPNIPKSRAQEPFCQIDSQ